MLKIFSSILEFIKYNKVIITLVIIGLSLYFMRYKEGFNEKKVVKPNKKDRFLPSKKFKGAKKGYVFKMDKNGLGYYIDN